jgi:chromate transporter
MQTLPSLAALFVCFSLIGMQSFGGGLSLWMRREIVQRRAWLDDRQFLSGMALCQIAPGPSAINLSVFVGTKLRGAQGACAALGGMMLVPVLLVLGIGALYFSSRTSSWIDVGMAGLGAAAIGLNLAAGLRMARSKLLGLPQVAVMLATALSNGVLGLDLLTVLAVMLPASWLVTQTGRE